MLLAVLLPGVGSMCFAVGGADSSARGSCRCSRSSNGSVARQSERSNEYCVLKTVHVFLLQLLLRSRCKKK